MSSERAPRETKSQGGRAARLQAQSNREMAAPASDVDQIVALQQQIGNQAVQRLIAEGRLPVGSGVLQAKLTVGPPDDRYEQEADSVAQQVMTMPDTVQRDDILEEEDELQMQGRQREDIPEEEELQMQRLQREDILEEDELQMQRLQREDIPEEEELQMQRLQREDIPEEDELQMQRLQRDDILEEEDELQMQGRQREDIPEEEELQMQRLQREDILEEDELQMKSVTGDVPEVTSDLESTIESRRGGGQALPDSARDFFEPRFGQDFSGVNIHTGGEADTLNRQLEARAFTTGGDIFFREGEYNPDSSAGRELLAHELTHVVQQGGSVRRKANGKVQSQSSSPDDYYSADPMQSISPTDEHQSASAPQMYNFTILGENHSGISQDDAIKVLSRLHMIISGWIEVGYDAHKDFAKIRDDQWLVSRLVGGFGFPDFDIWDKPRDLAQAAKSALSNQAVIEAATTLAKAENALAEASRQVNKYREGSISGAESWVTGLKVTVAVGGAAAGVATGGLATGASLIISSGIGAGTAGLYSLLSNASQQASEKYHHLRKEIDWSELLTKAGTDTVFGFAGGLAAGALAKQFYKLAPNYFHTFPDEFFSKINLSNTNRVLIELGLDPVFTRDAMIPLWQKSGMEFLSTMATTVFLEPIKLTLEKLALSGSLPTQDEFIEQLSLEFWGTKGAEAFISSVQVFAHI